MPTIYVSRHLAFRNATTCQQARNPTYYSPKRACAGCSPPCFKQIADFSVATSSNNEHVLMLASWEREGYTAARVLERVHVAAHIHPTIRAQTKFPCIYIYIWIYMYMYPVFLFPVHISAGSLAPFFFENPPKSLHCEGVPLCLKHSGHTVPATMMARELAYYELYHVFDLFKLCYPQLLKGI